MSWDQLRKEVRKLEGEVEARLVSYAKFGDNFAQSSLLEEASGVGELKDDGLYRSMSAEIEELLGRLSEMNNDMSALTSESVGAPSKMPILLHHRGKFQDYVQEFKKIGAKIRATREHAELLNSVRRDITMYKDSSHDSASHRARRSLAVSDRTADVIIEQAEMSRDALGSQQRSLRSALGRVGTFTDAFGAIESAMTNIKRKKFRDKIILAVVISICSTLLILYWLRDQGHI